MNLKPFLEKASFSKASGKFRPQDTTVENSTVSDPEISAAWGYHCDIADTKTTKPITTAMSCRIDGNSQGDKVDKTNAGPTRVAAVGGLREGRGRETSPEFGLPSLKPDEFVWRRDDCDRKVFLTTKSGAPRWRMSLDALLSDWMKMVTMLRLLRTFP